MYSPNMTRCIFPYQSSIFPSGIDVQDTAVSFGRFRAVSKDAGPGNETRRIGLVFAFGHQGCDVTGSLLDVVALLAVTASWNSASVMFASDRHDHVFLCDHPC